METINRVEMARLEILAVGFILAVTLNLVTCSNNKIESKIEVSIVPDMDKYLIQNPGLKGQPLLKDTKVNGISPYVMISYTLGKRIAGKAFEFEHIFTEFLPVLSDCFCN